MSQKLRRLPIHELLLLLALEERSDPNDSSYPNEPAELGALLRPTHRNGNSKSTRLGQKPREPGSGERQPQHCQLKPVTSNKVNEIKLNCVFAVVAVVVVAVVAVAVVAWLHDVAAALTFEAKFKVFLLPVGSSQSCSCCCSCCCCLNCFHSTTSVCAACGPACSASCCNKWLPFGIPLQPKQEIPRRNVKRQPIDKYLIQERMQTELSN